MLIGNGGLVKKGVVLGCVERMCESPATAHLNTSQ